MSLEEALNKNTEAMERLINVMSLKVKDEVNDTDKGDPVEKKATKAKAAAPKKAKAPAKSTAEVVDVTEPVVAESLFQADPEDASVVATVDAVVETVPQGSAPVSEGSDWYKYTMSRCNLLSATTGDPAATMAICAAEGVTDLATPGIDMALSKIGDIINAKLVELGVEG